MKKTSLKIMFFFDHIFDWILKGFGKGFGELLGEVWSLLVRPALIWGCLYDACVTNACSMASGRRLGSIGAFQVEISSIDIDVLWNCFSTLSVSCHANISFFSRRYPLFPPGRLRHQAR